MKLCNVGKRIDNVLLLKASHHAAWILPWSEEYGSMPITVFLLMVLELIRFTNLAEKYLHLCLDGLLIFRLILDTAYGESHRANTRTITGNVWQ